MVRTRTVRDRRAYSIESISLESGEHPVTSSLAWSIPALGQGKSPPRPDLHKAHNRTLLEFWSPGDLSARHLRVRENFGCENGRPDT